MDDVKKDRELIADAQKCAPGDCSTELAVMVHRLADALEESHGERDAALEAIERVRVMHRPYRLENNERYMLCVVCSVYSSVEDWSCPTVAALDGAPEPEWEYQCTNSINTVGPLADPEVHAKWCSGRIERRRKAGPWLPIEGESKS